MYHERGSWEEFPELMVRYRGSNDNSVTEEFTGILPNWLTRMTFGTFSMFPYSYTYLDKLIGMLVIKHI
jgi:hypothetical protein